MNEKVWGSQRSPTSRSPNLISIQEALITFCQREIGEIANIFTDRAYREFKDPECDETELEEKEDPYKFKYTKLLRAMKQNEKDAIEYHKSRIKLYGTIISG